MMSSNVKLKLLKEFAKKEMKDYPITQGCILVEPRDIPDEAFVNKLKLWLMLLKMETGAKSR